MLNESNRDVFNATGGWTIIHRAGDDWEINLIRAAFSHAQIPHKIVEERDSDRRLWSAVAVPVEVEDEALETLLRVVNVAQAPATSDDRTEVVSEPSDGDEPFAVRAVATDVPVRLIAEREGIGSIVHVEGHGYELCVGPEPYFIVPDERWEEFTDFSAQRQEFAILLEKEFAPLYRWLRDEKKFGDFLKLVESTYRGSAEEDTPEHFLRAAGWMLAILLGIVALVALVRWLEGLTLGVAD
jgi:hypothetical protein